MNAGLHIAGLAVLAKAGLEQCNWRGCRCGGVNDCRTRDLAAKRGMAVGYCRRAAEGVACVFAILRR